MFNVSKKKRLFKPMLSKKAIPELSGYCSYNFEKKKKKERTHRIGRFIFT
jgi:hypothetical protein